MTPYEEMRALGALGPVQYVWLVETVQFVARTYGFPPEGGGQWTEDLARTWLHELLLGPKGMEFLVRVGITASDDASFGRLVRRSLKNAFIDEARSKVEGRLRVRMRKLLAKQADFVDFTAIYAGTNAWGLRDLGDRIWAGDWETLLHAPGLSSVGQIAKLNEGGPTSAANITKLVEATRLVLQAADGALTDQVIAKVLVRIFDLDETLNPYFLDERDSPTLETESSEDLDDEFNRDAGWDSPTEYESPGEYLSFVQAADALEARMTSDQLKLLPLADVSSEDIADALPGHLDPLAAIADAIRDFRKIATELETPQESLLIVLARCRARLED